MCGARRCRPQAMARRSGRARDAARRQGARHPPARGCEADAREHVQADARRADTRGRTRAGQGRAGRSAMKFDTPATTNPIDRLKVIGKPTDRVEGPLKTTGSAPYAY